MKKVCAKGIFNKTQVRKSQGQLGVGDLEPEVSGDPLCFALRLCSWLLCLLHCPISRSALGNQSHNSGPSFVTSKHLYLFLVPPGCELGSIRGELWKMGTKFNLPFSKPKDCRCLLLHRRRVSPRERFDSKRNLLLALPRSPNQDGGVATPQLTFQAHELSHQDLACSQNDSGQRT